jgi:hypothetical protein
MKSDASVKAIVTIVGGEVMTLPIVLTHGGSMWG